MSLQTPEFWVVIPAAGRGSRMQQSTAKQYLELSGRKVIEYSLERFSQDQEIRGIIIVTDDDETVLPIIEKFQQSYPKIHFQITRGGAERADSVRLGLKAVKTLSTNDNVWVLVHDAARPCLTTTDLIRLKQSTKNYPEGAILAAPIVDTLKQIKHSRITETHNRQLFMRALTPQMAPLKLLSEAVEHCQKNNVLITDEAQALETFGASVGVVEGRHDNIKITYPEDLALAEFILKQQASELESSTVKRNAFSNDTDNTGNSDRMKK